MKTKNIKYKILNSKNTSQISNILFLICIFAIYYLLFAIDKAEAKALSLGISPPLIQIQLDPPATINTPIAIHNYGDETVTLAISLKPFMAVASLSNATGTFDVPSDATSAESENGEVAYLWDKKPPLILQNIKVRDNGDIREEIILAPRQKKNLSLHLDIPKGELSSDYYFSVVFISKNVANAGLSHSQIRGAIATNVLLSIGTGKSIGKIAEFSAPFFLERQPVPFTIRLKNEGKHFITPQGTILIKNIFGKTIGELNLLPVNILAGTTRKEKAILQEHILFGPYSATLTITLSDHGPILTKNVRFLVLPIKAFVGLAVIVFIILLVQKRLKTHRER